MTDVAAFGGVPGKGAGFDALADEGVPSGFLSFDFDLEEPLACPHRPGQTIPDSTSRTLEDFSKICARLAPQNVSRRGFTKMKFANEINDTALQKQSLAQKN